MMTAKEAKKYSELNAMPGVQDQRVVNRELQEAAQAIKSSSYNGCTVTYLRKTIHENTKQALLDMGYSVHSVGPPVFSTKISWE